MRPAAGAASASAGRVAGMTRLRSSHWPRSGGGSEGSGWVLLPSWAELLGDQRDGASGEGPSATHEETPMEARDTVMDSDTPTKPTKPTTPTTPTKPTSPTEPVPSQNPNDPTTRPTLPTLPTLPTVPTVPPPRKSL
jgi:hypothetical protein